MAVNGNHSLLFLSGYTQIYLASNQMIPTSILHLIQVFYTIPWRITKNNDGDHTNNQIIYGPEFILDTYSLNCFVQLAYDPKRDNIILYLNPDRLPYDIINFILLFQVHSNMSILQAKLSFNGRKIKTGDSPDNTIQWSPWGKRWQCITKISSKLSSNDKKQSDQTSNIYIENMDKINVSVDILTVNHFKLNAYNSINLALNGLHKYESHSEFECTQCTINITKTLSKVSLSIKPQDLSYRLYRVFILFKLLSKWNDVLFQYGGIYYLDRGISFQCNSKKFWDANKLTMTVMKVLENSGKMVPMEQWIDCGIEGDLNFVRFEKMSTKSQIHWQCRTTTAGFYGEYGDLIWC